ncbi:MAG: PIN domain-containing protein [Acidobacteriota bacterium]
MKGRFFLDTNVFVYSFDDRAPEKRARAIELIKAGLESQAGVISWQVLQEFLNVALHRFSKPMNLQEAEDYLHTVLLPLCRVMPSAELYREALMIQNETRYRFFDALIVASALRSNAEKLYSEDLQHGRTVRGLKIQDPFRS